MTKVLKFGGSSVATADGMRQVANIIINVAKEDQVVIVVSALRNVTDQLIECAMLAADGQGGYLKIFDQIAERHRKLVTELLGQSDNIDHESFAHQSIEKILNELSEILKSIKYLHDNHAHARDLIVSFGERLSATILSAYINSQYPSRFVDARQFMITTNDFTNAKVLYEITSGLIQNYFKEFFRKERAGTIPIVTGFIGMTEDKQTTTIGRDGSNYTASVLGAALRAEVQMWTDVDGVHTANPKQVDETVVLKQISYQEAQEMSCHQTKVVRQIIIPQLVDHQGVGMSVTVKNTFNPNSQGTTISLKTNHGDVKNISLMDGLLLLTLSPIEYVMPNLMERLYHALTNANLYFMLVTQASKANEVCFVIRLTDLQKTQQAVEHEFLYEFQQNLLTMETNGEQSLIALIGNGVRESLASLGEVFITLDKNKIPLTGIAHGTSDCNISFIVPSADSLKALRSIHECVFKDQKKALEKQKEAATQPSRPAVSRSTSNLGHFKKRSFEKQQNRRYEADNILKNK